MIFSHFDQHFAKCSTDIERTQNLKYNFDPDPRNSALYFRYCGIIVNISVKKFLFPSIVTNTTEKSQMIKDWWTTMDQSEHLE
jgi:hypothetical protein